MKNTNELMTAQEFVGEPPETLEEAVQRVTELIVDGNGEDLFDDTLDGFHAAMHHNLGQHVRNYWGLWSQDSGLYKELAGEYCLSHADDISGLLFTAVYNEWHDLPHGLNNQAADYHKHWASMLAGEPITKTFTFKKK